MHRFQFLPLATGRGIDPSPEVRGRGQPRYLFTRKQWRLFFFGLESIEMREPPDYPPAGANDPGGGRDPPLGGIISWGSRPTTWRNHLVGVATHRWEESSRGGRDPPLGGIISWGSRPTAGRNHLVGSRPTAGRNQYLVGVATQRWGQNPLEMKRPPWGSRPTEEEMEDAMGN